MHETSTLSEDSALPDPAEFDSAEMPEGSSAAAEADSPAAAPAAGNGPPAAESLPAVDAPPADVLDIVASLDAEASETSPDSEDVGLAGEKTEAEGATRVAEPPETEEATRVAELPETGDAGAVEAVEQPAGAEANDPAGALAAAEAVLPEEPRFELEAPAGEIAVVGARVPTWPFLAYLGLWIVGAVAAAWFLTQTSAGLPVFSTDLYRTVVIAGLGLTALGPLLILIVWLALLLGNRGVSHAGLFTGSLMRGALATLCGVAIWWAVLLIIDTVRLGRPL